MKVTKRIMLTAGLLLAGAAALPAQNLKADIPFDFYVGNAKLSAGIYDVINVMETQAGHYYRLREKGSSKSALAVLPIPVSAGSPSVSDTRMVFRCAQGECELYEVWIAPTGTKVRAGQSKRFQGINTEIASVVLKNGM